MRTSLFLFLATLCSVTATPSRLALAEEAAPVTSSDSEPAPAVGHSRRSQFSIEVLPTYIHLQDKLSSVFTQNGFNAPTQDRFGLGLLVFWEVPSHWQLGLGIDDTSFSQDNGAYEGSFDQEVLSLYLAYNFTAGTPFDLTLGSLMGYGVATLEILSPNLNGRVTEGSFVLEPRLGFAYRIARSTKIGLMGSYVLPVGQSQDSKGQSLGVGHISTQGPALSFQLIFGIFGPLS